ncbi:MAG: hypothetical protein K1X66_06850 [Verrucomicrobiae bacterium]|nr:hypothetical protein [Verrucomicrobiae bacterium]
MAKKKWYNALLDAVTRNPYKALTSPKILEEIGKRIETNQLRRLARMNVLYDSSGHTQAVARGRFFGFGDRGEIAELRYQNNTSYYDWQFSRRYVDNLNPVSWHYFINNACKKTALEHLEHAKGLLSKLADARKALTDYRTSGRNSFRDMDFEGEGFKRFEGNLGRANSELQKSLDGLYDKAERAYGEAIEVRKAAERIAQLPNAPDSAQDILKAAQEAEKLAEKHLGAIDNAKREIINFDMKNISNPMFTPHNLLPVEGYLNRLSDKMDDIQKTADDFSRSVGASMDEAKKLVGGGAALAVLGGTSYDPNDGHPLGAKAVGKSILRSGREVAGMAGKVVETADCIMTLGGCYAMDYVMEKAVVPVAENVVVPVANHTVVPVVKAGIAVGGKAVEVATPVVNEVAGAVDQHVVKPVATKLDKAFNEPARIAGEASKASWGISVPW